MQSVLHSQHSYRYGFISGHNHNTQWRRQFYGTKTRTASVVVVVIVDLVVLASSSTKYML